MTGSLTFDEWLLLLAIGAAILSTVAMAVSLIRRKQPVRAILRKWLSRLMDAFWGAG